VYALHARNTEAQNHWRQAASLDQANLACRQALGQSLARERRFAEAARIYQELCQLAPGNLNFILSKGSIEQQQGAVEQAEKTYLQATRIDPDYPNAPAALARLYLETGKDLPAARRWAERVIQLQPTAENFYFLSSACRANQDLGGARAAIKEAVRLDPSNPQYAAAARVLLKE
jgi:cytochrome c-type biogenesis protein CcmH/NrfG